MSVSCYLTMLMKLPWMRAVSVCQHSCNAMSSGQESFSGLKGTSLHFHKARILLWSLHKRWQHSHPQPNGFIESKGSISQVWRVGEEQSNLRDKLWLKIRSLVFSRCSPDVLVTWGLPGGAGRWQPHLSWWVLWGQWGWSRRLPTLALSGSKSNHRELYHLNYTGVIKASLTIVGA